MWLIHVQRESDRGSDEKDGYDDYNVKDNVNKDDIAEDDDK